MPGQPTHSDVKTILTEKLKELTLSISTVVINACFLAGWAAIQFGLQCLIGILQLEETLNSNLLFGFRVVFALSTFLFVLMGICRDVFIMFYRIKRKVNRERQIDSS